MSSAKINFMLTRMVALTQTQWLAEAGDKDMHRLFVSASGYEARNRTWVEATITRFKPSEKSKYMVIGFVDFAHVLSRDENDDFYRKLGLGMTSIDSNNGKEFADALKYHLAALLHDASGTPVEVHVDYSCMPRLWYCNLPLHILPMLRSNDRLVMWYTPGEYPDAEFPTAGVDDFHVFSGQPSLSPRFRTHIFGLGFDRIRSQAIWSVLDPQNLVCFYADPGIKHGYVDRVKNDNRDVLSAAEHIFSVPLTDFPFAYGMISSIVADFRVLGDVVLVPDGPKPLILAASLIPCQRNEPGVVCCHVKRRKAADFRPVDVTPAGEPFGFAVPGCAS